MHFLALALALTPLAEAGSITVEKKGLFPVYAWVDAQPHGKVKKKSPLTVNVDDGQHEVWIAVEESGTVTTCHGMVDVSGAATVSAKNLNCEGLTPGYPAEGGFFRGASVTFRMDSGVIAWVSVDGGQALSMPSIPIELNLAPGGHNIVLYTDVMKGAVFAQGSFTLAPGERLPITCTTAGCVGWDVPPVIIQEYTTVVAPGISVDIDVDVSVPSIPAPAPAGDDGPGSCCINGAHYDCPTAAAVYKCSGAFMQCQMGCDMTDFGCTEACLQSHPLDPSDCSRAPARDGECE
jgi:hypothetical protein